MKYCYLFLLVMMLLCGLAFVPGLETSLAASPDESDEAEAKIDGAPLRFCVSYEEIKRRGFIRVGAGNQGIPFGFIDGANQWVGFDVDMLAAVARRLGVRMKKTVVNNRTRLSFLQGRKLDLVAANMTHKRVREKYIDFTHTYFRDGQKFLAPKGRYRDVRDLMYDKIGSMQGTTSIVNANRYLQRLGNRSPKIIGYDGEVSMFQALRSGRVDAITTDATILLGYAAKMPGRFEIIGDFISSEPYGMGVQKGSCMRQVVNRALNDIWDSGEYMAIYDKWFGPNSAYPLPLTEQWTRERGFPGQYP